MYKYITRTALLLAVIFLFGCEIKDVDPENPIEAKAGKKITVSGYGIELLPGYDQETMNGTYKWTWKITFENLKKFNLLLCEDVREHVVKASYRVGTTGGYTDIALNFQGDESLELTDCSSFADYPLLTFPVNQCGYGVIYIKVEIDEAFPVAADANMGIFRYQNNGNLYYECTTLYFEGPECNGGGQEEECCYTCADGWAAITEGYCPFPGTDLSTYIVYGTNVDNIYPIFAEGNQVGVVTITRANGKYTYEFDMTDDWFVCQARIQVFMTLKLNAWWIQDGNPITDKFSTKWDLDPMPEFTDVEGCLQTDYEWSEENLIITGGQPSSVGKRIAIYTKLAHRVCGTEKP
jgi:hypothetical protein